VLARAGQAAGITAPQLASIRSIYRRRMTLYHHQQAAMAALGFKDYGEASECTLTGHLRRMATKNFDRAALMRQAMAWLNAHHWVLPGQSRIAPNPRKRIGDHHAGVARGGRDMAPLAVLPADRGEVPADRAVRPARLRQHRKPGRHRLNPCR
jgi:Domain of unknown function (DUF4158)